MKCPLCDNEKRFRQYRRYANKFLCCACDSVFWFWRPL